MTQSPPDISDAPFRIVDGWLNPARKVESPNFNQRAVGEAVDLLVIHNISLPPGQFGTGCVEQFFCNQLDHSAHPFFTEIKSLQVSSHLLIERSGEVIQFVSFDDRAWHAGLSCFQGRESCNDFSIGIELEGTDDTPYTDEQYRQLALVTRVIQNSYPAITTDRIAGHSDIAPERKTDPGPAFDWERFRRELATGSR
jgi:N-acetyl-anhydromuramoyl-L-alanine amidase